MKFVIYLSLPIIMFLSGCKQSSEQEKLIVDNTRMSVIKLDQKFNKLYNVVMSQQMQGNSNFDAAAICLQQLAKELIDVNKSLEIDCKQYDENGEVVMMNGKNGLSPVEIVPNELKIQ